MKVAEIQELQIVDLTRQGDGVGRLDGLAVFVPGALPGERVKVELTEKKKSFARAKLLEIQEVSPARREPFCSQSKSCGGCGLGHLDYNNQLTVKEKWVKDTLSRIGNIDEKLVESIVGMEGEPYRYRNKAVMPVGRGPKGTCTVGYHQARSHQVTDCRACLLQTEAADLLAEGLRRYVKESGCSVYDDKEGKGILRQLMVRTGFGTNQVMAMLHVTNKEIPNPQLLADCLVDALEETDFELVSLVLCVNKEKGAKGLMGGQCITLAG
ncbi:MAG: class I SAM-dependent RNA methyltransferase, partial [Firmicutes bacterium]|nr:class I SAM-dependent RNA methyltransferase [Bacillota bacterium]